MNPIMKLKKVVKKILLEQKKEEKPKLIFVVNIIF